MSRHSIRRPAITSAVLAGAAARAAYAGLRRRPPGGTGTWSRTNHRGEPVTLLEGPAVAIGAVTGALVAPGLTRRGRAALLVAGAGAAVLGCYDDLAGSGSSRGFRGHLGALRRGELTTGAVKIAGIGATGLAASALLGGTNSGGASDDAGPLAAAADVAINAGLIAGGANLLNLFDLRPGRAIKVALGTGTLVAAARPGRAAAAAPLGAAAALLGEDLGERAMLGDGGANALGAMLGTAAAVSLPRSARVAALAAIVGLTAASEVVSFTKVIQNTPALNWLDMLGRRPPAPAGPATGGSGQAAAGSGMADEQASQNGPAGTGAGTAAGGAVPGGPGTGGPGTGGTEQEPAAPAASAPR